MISHCEENVTANEAAEPSSSQHCNPLSSKIGVVAIGRNEGDRLKKCVASLADTSLVVYVDSGSTDDSVEFALKRGLDVIILDAALPFTAARARNVGFERLRKVAPGLHYVLFVDGDCEIVEGWIEKSVSFLGSNPKVAAVCGRLRERHPEQSVYNWLCDREWDGPVGEIQACGGNFLISAEAFEAVHGFRTDLIAGEESELCIRLRQSNWKIWRLDTEMALHDSAMTKFSQWLRRSVRSGYAFAQGTYLHGSGPERHWVWESRRAMIWGLYLPLSILAVSAALSPWASLGWALYPAQIGRQILRNSGTLKDRATLALFQLLARFPESWGQVKFASDRLLHRDARIIEHK